LVTAIGGLLVARYLRGSLIARSAMMFFCTCVVPAPIEV
jgi:hypothetical protein